MLEARALSVRFGGVQALDDVSLAVAAGSITALIGPNGAGKSTLFGVLSGFLAPDSGSVRFLGADVTGLAPHRICRLGMTRTFQIVQPFAAQTVRENIALGAHLARASRREALAHAERIAAQLGLGAQLDKLAANLTVAGENASSWRARSPPGRSFSSWTRCSRGSIRRKSPRCCRWCAPSADPASPCS